MQKYKYPLLTIILSLLISWPLLLPGYFSHHDDLQIMRIFEMRKCLVDLQIPCRWVPDMGYGNGYPLFNYYGVFPYYLGALISFVAGYIWSAKILFLISIVSGGISMFLLAKSLWGERGGLVSAVLYLYAPYKALDVYVRGALAESFSLGFLPFAFYFGWQLILKNSLINLLGFCLSLMIVLTTHNIMTLFFIPILLLWLTFWLYREKFNNLKSVMMAGGLGFGLSAFFILPSFLEKSLVHTETLTRFDLDFRVHFVTLAQIFFDRSWGYGASQHGPVDSISFQVGWPLWILVLIVAIYYAYLLISKKLASKLSEIVLFTLLLLLFLLSLFMMHTRSAFIWEKLPLLHYAQFPWRFLAIAIFSGSLLGGKLITFFNKKFQYLAIIILVPLTIALNWHYFRPEKFYFDLTDSQKLSGAFWEEQQKAAIFDYLPKTAIEAREKASNNPIIAQGDGEVTNFTVKSNYWSFKSKSDKPMFIEMPIYDFAGWRVKVDQKQVDHTWSSIGRINFTLPAGQHVVEGVFSNTFIRDLANLITLASILVLGFVIYNYRKK